MIESVKKLLIFSVLFILFVNFSYSKSKNPFYNQLKKAEALYQKGDYEKALDIYKKIENKIKDYKLYYNIGNIYFKLKNYPLAKVYYLRAYKIKQNDSDLKHNLKVIELHLKDKIKLPESDPFTKILENFKNSMSINSFFIISLILFILLSTIFNFYKGKYKKTILYVLLLFLLLFFIIDIIKLNDYKTDKYVLLKNRIEVKSEPTDKGNSVFIIHAGTDFKIKEKLSGWYLIVLKNGFRGWIKSQENKDFLKI